MPTERQSSVWDAQCRNDHREGAPRAVSVLGHRGSERTMCPRAKRWKAVKL